MVFQQIRHLFITLDATDKATRKLKQVNRTTDELSESQRHAAEQTRKFRKRMVAAGFGAAILTGAMAQMIQMSAGVSRTFARIEGTAGATEEQMKKIRAEAEKIGAEMPVLMTGAAEAFEQLSFAGFSVQEQLAAANDVVELAIAGGIKMGEAARTAASAIRAFGMEAKEIGQITETMAATFTNSSFNMEEMAQSLEYAMSTASQADQAFGEVAAALGTLADIGLRGTKAGTALERMFTRLAKQNGETEDAMKKLGLTMSDLTDNKGDFKDLSEIVQVIGDDIEEMSSGGAETLQLLQELFGARGGRAAAGLVNNTDKFLEKIGDNARAEIGATMKTLGEMNEQELTRSNEVMNMLVDNMENLSFNLGDSSTEQVLDKLVQASDAVSESDMANAVNMAFNGISSKSAEILSKDVAALRQLREQASGLSDQQLQTQVSTEFNLGDIGAKQMTEAIRAGEGVQFLARSIEDMTTSAELSQAQVESLWGQLEYLQGSIETLILRMVSGMKPALDVFFAGAKGLLNILNSNRAVVKGLGLGMALLTGTLIVLTAAYAKLAISNHLAAIKFWETATAQKASTAATWSQITATNILTMAKNGTLVATIRQTAAEYASAAAKYVNEAASLTLVVAELMLGRTTTWNAMQRLGYNNMMRLSTMLKWKNLAVTYALAAGEWVLAAGGWAATSAVIALGAAWTAFLALPLIGQLAIIAGLLLALVLTVGEVTGRFLSWSDAAGQAGDALGGVGGMIDWLLTPVWMLIDAIVWLGELFYDIGVLALVGTFELLADVIEWTAQRFADLYDWYKSLGPAGKVLIGILLPFLPLMWGIQMAMQAVGDTTGWLGEKWAEFTQIMSRGWTRMGLLIGDSIRGVVNWFRKGGEAVDKFAADVNGAIGYVATLLRTVLTLDFFGLLINEAMKAGGGLIDAFMAGAKSKVAQFKSWFKGFLSDIRDYLPFSDAKKGPLSNLTASGMAFAQTFADGIKSGKSLVMGAVRGITETAKDLASKTEDLANGVGEQLSSKVDSAVSTAKRGADVAGDKVADGIDSAMSAANKGAEFAGSAGQSVASSVTADVSMAGDVAGAVGSKVSSVLSAATNGSDFVGTAVKKVAGGIGSAASMASDVAGAVAGASGLGGPSPVGGTNVSQQNQQQIIFQGEVHDAEKVADQVRRGVKEASDEAQGAIEDGLDMASDAAGDLGGLF